MESTLVHAGIMFMGFFAIMNPIANAPIFLSLTKGLDEKTTRGIAFRALVITFIIVAIFSLAGKMVFELFGLSMPAFRIAGGIVVSLIGYHMLHGSHSQIHQPKDTDSQSSQDAAMGIAVSPLAMPILAGPGTIATAMNFSAQSGDTHLISALAIFAFLCVVTFVCFISAHRIVGFLGESFMSVITRIMGLILTVMGVQMAIEGIKSIAKQM